MDKYIFTLLDPKGSEVDFRVGEFPSAEHALRLAELIALATSADRHPFLSMIVADAAFNLAVIGVASVSGRWPRTPPLMQRQPVPALPDGECLRK